MCIVCRWYYEYLQGFGGVKIQKEISSLLYFTQHCFKTEIVFAVAIKRKGLFIENMCFLLSEMIFSCNKNAVESFCILLVTSLAKKKVLLHSIGAHVQRVTFLIVTESTV